MPGHRVRPTKWSKVPAYSSREENTVSGPLISITTARIKEGKLEDYKRFVRESMEHFKAKEPQLIAMHMFLNEDGTEMTSIQVHPNSASMDFHLQVLNKVLGEEMSEWVKRADFLEIKHLEVYGTPSASLLQSTQQAVDSGVFTRSVKPVHLAGFTRSSVGVS
jgi:hypothetical protein